MPFHIQTQSGNLLVDVNPEQCPVCLHAVHPLEAGAFLIGRSIERVLRCPRSQCGRVFIARYQHTQNTPNGPLYSLREQLPLTIVVSQHNEIIKAVSPDFVAIYAEAEKAELSGLKLICGPGYRKALEFLIKDYVIRSHAGKADEIKRLNLAKCITEYVPDEKVKRVAARGVWLGNDETHYLRKWEEKDVKDPKALIRLTLHWIEMDELTQQTLRDMPEGK